METHSWSQLSVTYRKVRTTLAALPIRWVDGAWHWTWKPCGSLANILPTALSRQKNKILPIRFLCDILSFHWKRRLTSNTILVCFFTHLNSYSFWSFMLLREVRDFSTFYIKEENRKEFKSTIIFLMFYQNFGAIFNKIWNWKYNLMQKNNSK